MSCESTETIGVYVRVRSSDSTGVCVQVSPTTGEITALRAPRPGEVSSEAVHSFRFDQVGDAGTDQAAVFEAVGRPIADAALEAVATGNEEGTFIPEMSIHEKRELRDEVKDSLASHRRRM